MFVTTLAPTTFPYLLNSCFNAVALVVEDRPDTHRFRPDAPPPLLVESATEPGEDAPVATPPLDSLPAPLFESDLGDFWPGLPAAVGAAEPDLAEDDVVVDDFTLESARSANKIRIHMKNIHTYQGQEQ